MSGSNGNLLFNPTLELVIEVVVIIKADMFRHKKMLPIKSIIFDKIDKTDCKIDNYRFLTTNPFIDFYRFPIQSTNFIDCYLMLSIIDFIDCPSWV